MRLADIEPLIKNGWVLERHGVANCHLATMSLADVPTIDPESLRPKGRWEDMYGGRYDNSLYVCSVCREPALEKSATDFLGRWWSRQEPSNYCPNCGADMRGNDNE